MDDPQIPILKTGKINGSLFTLHFLQIKHKIDVIPNEDLQGPIRQSFLWYDNDKNLKACFSVTRLSYVTEITW